MGKSIGEAFGALFPVVNPVAVIPIFPGMTAGRMMAIGVEMIVHRINEHEALRAFLG